MNHRDTGAEGTRRGAAARGGTRVTAGGLAAVALAALLAAACGASRAAVRSAPVPSLSEAITCSVEQGEEMRFEAVAVNRDEPRVVLERTDGDVGRSDPSFRRAVDQLIATGGDREPGAGPALAIEARTYHEHFDRRGRTRRQRDPSPGVLAAADSLLDRCAGDAGS